MTEKTSSLLGIIGYPIGHSVSPVFQQAALNHAGIDAKYLAWETPPENLSDRINSLKESGVIGANVTVPHKQSVLPFLDNLSKTAREIGAVNTIVNDKGVLYGHNTDVFGFMKSLHNDGDFFADGGQSALVLGAGGSAKAIAYGLLRDGIKKLVISNRTLSRAVQLKKELGNPENVFVATPESTDMLRDHHLIVNCTTLGMKHGPGEDKSPLSPEHISKGTVVFDLVYNPRRTPLIKEAMGIGARAISGLPMLIYQGAEAFRLWTGINPPTEVMFDAAENALKG
ncbi:MAG: shikimate dehydrogenase [Chloroflexi bacterium]|jgi:shikimate dehydrogenase|nr:MAG: shikimate dehydrogenase [Chloroflexota bacterium]